MAVIQEGKVNIIQELAINNLRIKFTEGLEEAVDFFLGLSGVNDKHHPRHVAEECLPCAQREACERVILESVWGNRKSIVDAVQGTPDFSHRRHGIFAENSQV